VAQIFDVWMTVVDTERIFKVRGQLKVKVMIQPNAIMAEACISAAWRQGCIMAGSGPGDVAKIWP